MCTLMVVRHFVDTSTPTFLVQLHHQTASLDSWSQIYNSFDRGPRRATQSARAPSKTPTTTQTEKQSSHQHRYEHQLRYWNLRSCSRRHARSRRRAQVSSSNIQRRPTRRSATKRAPRADPAFDVQTVHSYFKHDQNQRRVLYERRVMPTQSR